MDFLLLAAAITILLLLLLSALQYRHGRRQHGHTQLLREELIKREAEEQHYHSNLSRLEQDIRDSNTRYEESQSALQQAIQSEKLAQQKLEHEQLARKDWEAQRAQFEQMAKASVMAAGQELSSKLLEDHKREAQEVRETFKKEKQEENQKIRDYLTQLNERLSNSEKLALDTKQQNDILWRTFSSPSSTGQLAEIGLDNLLKNMGLLPGSDYIMQYTVANSEGGVLRPDCVIKLPNQRIVVIDCKASKHVLAMAESQGTVEEAQQHQNFLTTMREHLKALSRKDYATAIQQEAFLNKRDIRSGQIISVMYLPSSAAVELLYKLDPDLIDRSEKQGTIIIGPGMLHGLIYLISKEITDERKLENQEKIIHEVERLLGALAATFGHITKVGNSIKSLTSNFSKISGSFNVQVAPKLRNLNSLGIKPHGTNAMPEQLESYELRSLSETIDLTPEEDGADGSSAAVSALEDFRPQKTTKAGGNA